METLACNAPAGQGGLGRHLECAISEARSAGRLAGYFATGIPQGEAQGTVIPPLDWIGRIPLLRQSPAWKSFLANEGFDRRVAAHLSRPEVFVGFGGQAHRSFTRARQLKATGLVLESATAHVDHVFEQQEKASRHWPIEGGWLNDAQRNKTLAEYQDADVIKVNSPYTLATFLERGVPAAKLVVRELSAHPRFQRRPPPVPDGTIRIVYVGALTVLKGISVLLEAFAQLRSPAARLILVGGWTTRGMRRYLQAWCARDARISVTVSDPLPILMSASVLVHPSFSDGFGLAPLEALRCGVPVVVTEHTGMKSLVQEGVTGHVLPTGNVTALADCLRTWVPS